MNTIRLALSAALCLVFSGCDKIMEGLPTFREKRVIEKAVAETSEQEEDVRATAKVDIELLAFKQHVESTEAILAGELASASARVCAVQGDSDALAKAMAAAASGKSADGTPSGRKGALVALLRADAVNSLARRYLGRTFSLVALEVEQRVGEAEELERLRKMALSANEAETKASVDLAKAEGRRASESALEGQRKLKRELETLRRRKRRLENEFNMAPAADRGRKRHEISQVNDEILRMEREYDGLRVSRTVSRDVQISEEKVRQAQLAADARRTKASVKFGNADSASPADVAAEFERTTVLALEKAIADELVAAEARKDGISRAAEYVKQKGNVRHSLSASALREIKADIDAHVAAALGKSK